MDASVIGPGEQRMKLQYGVNRRISAGTLP